MYLLFQLKPKDWLVVPRQMYDNKEATCRMLGAGGRAFFRQEGRCYRMKDSYVLYRVL